MVNVYPHTQESPVFKSSDEAGYKKSSPRKSHSSERGVGVYLFVGQDNIAKDAKLASIKEEFLAKDLADFNLDVLYAKELRLADLQEKLLRIPFKSKKRIVVIKDAQNLNPDIKGYLLKHAKQIDPSILLVLDVNSEDLPKSQSNLRNTHNEFIRQISRYANTLRFKEPVAVDTFTLSRNIELKKADSALRILNKLLESGEKPERILGGLRYSWQNSAFTPAKLKNRLKLLLDCDIDIKTGKLKPDFALEKLLIKLCM